MKTWWAVAFGVAGGLLGAGILWLASSPPQGKPVALLPPPTPAPFIIHVTGAVVHPGVYSLPRGCRVQDAVEAAGGSLPEANTQALNLAAPVQDGDRVSVPTQGPKSSPLMVDPSHPGQNPSQQSPVPISPGLININTASQEELESLPGIGPVTAQKIIAFREENGLFNNIEAVLDVPGIGPVTFDKLKDLITVEGWPF